MRKSSMVFWLSAASALTARWKHLICNHRTNAMAECLLAGEEGWMFSPLSGETATLTHSSMPDKKMEMYHHLLILQCLDLSLAL